MFCHMCGTKLLEGAAFCHVCGAKAGKTEAVKPETPAVQLDFFDRTFAADGENYWCRSHEENNRVVIRCIYKERDTWKTAENREFAEKAWKTTDLFAYCGQVYFLASSEDEDQNLFCRCKRQGEEIVIEKSNMKNSGILTEQGLYAPVLQGDHMFGVEKERGRWFDLDLKYRSVTAEFLPAPPCMTVSGQTQYSPENSSRPMEMAGSYLYKNAVFTSARGLQTAILKFPLCDPQAIKHVNSENSKFIMSGENAVCGHRLLGFQGKNLQILDLDTMEATVVPVKYKIRRLCGWLMDNYLLVCDAEDNYMAFNTVDTKFYRLPAEFFLYEEDEREWKIEVQRMIRAEGVILFEYGKEYREGLFCSVIPQKALFEKDARIVDYEIGGKPKPEFHLDIVQTEEFAYRDSTDFYVNGTRVTGWDGVFACIKQEIVRIHKKPYFDGSRIAMESENGGERIQLMTVEADQIWPEDDRSPWYWTKYLICKSYNKDYISYTVDEK